MMGARPTVMARKPAPVPPQHEALSVLRSASHSGDRCPTAKLQLSARPSAVFVRPYFPRVSRNFFPCAASDKPIAMASPPS